MAASDHEEKKMPGPTLFPLCHVWRTSRRTQQATSSVQDRIQSKRARTNIYFRNKILHINKNFFFSI